MRLRKRLELNLDIFGPNNSPYIPPNDIISDYDCHGPLYKEEDYKRICKSIIEEKPFYEKK